MKTFKTITYKFEDQIATIYLNRPKIHNAFNETMISELIEAFDFIGAQPNETVRVIVLRGLGKSFCAGADLNWMRGVADYSYEQNYEESYQLSKCFYAIYKCKKPTIAIVHGAAIGGANGLLAACDFAFAENETVFSLSEVKIGIVPACISPYIIKRVGEYNAKYLMLTGKRIKGKEAEKFRLINESFDKEALEKHLEETVKLLKTSGPEAMTQCKTLIHEISNNQTIEQALKFTAEMIADIRASEEGQEGMAAFLEKRKPNWVKK